MVRALVMRKNLPDISDAVTIARETMLQLFINGERQMAKGAERVWNALITDRNSAQAQKCKLGDQWHNLLRAVQ